MMRFGTREVLAEAASFVNNSTITEQVDQNVDYYRLLMGRHEIICAEAATCDSFLPTRRNLAVLGRSQRGEISSGLPKLETSAESHGPLARCHPGATTH